MLAFECRCGSRWVEKKAKWSTSSRGQSQSCVWGGGAAERKLRHPYQSAEPGMRNFDV